MTLPETMKAMLLTGHGGLGKLDWREDVAVPKPAAGEVLVRVGAAAVNNTDVNTRTGWYSKAVRGDTGSAASEGYDGASDADGGWSGARSAGRATQIVGVSGWRRSPEVGELRRVGFAGHDCAGGAQVCDNTGVGGGCRARAG